jgi:hypothetical protein
MSDVSEYMKIPDDTDLDIAWRMVGEYYHSRRFGAAKAYLNFVRRKWQEGKTPYNIPSKDMYGKIQSMQYAISCESDDD